MTNTSCLIQELGASLGENALRLGDDMAPWLTDFRGRVTGTATAVALPANTAEVSAAVTTATSRGIPVFPQGGNTGLCYGAVPQGGLVVGLQRMRQVGPLDKASGLLTVQAGAPLATVHAAAEEADLQFPLHLGSEGTAQIGGLISTNAGGTGAFRYGTMRNLVAGVELVLADGRVINDMSALAKDNRGYSLTQLVAGAEGTLGVITGATLKVSQAVRSTGDAWLALSDLAAALEVATALRTACGDVLEALELLDRNQVAHCMRHIDGLRIPFNSPPEWSLMIRLASPRIGENLTNLLTEILTPLFEKSLIDDAMIAQTEAQAQDIWRLRHSVTEANKAEGIGVVMDASLRPSAVQGFVNNADQVLAARFPQAERAIVSHLGDGNVHYIAMFPHDYWSDLPDKTAKELDVETALHDVIASYNGSFSAEHGIGRKLTPEMARLMDPVRVEIMRGIKKAFDPQNLMNPGILIP